MQALANQRIFIFESHPLDRIAMQMYLARAGAWQSVVSTRTNPIECLEQFTHADLILLGDLRAYEINIREMFEQIRNLDKYINTPIVVVATIDLVIDNTLCHEVGFTGFIQKPINHKSFILQVSNILEDQSTYYPEDGMK